MEVKVSSVRPYERATLPALQFDVEIEYQKFGEVIWGYQGI
jgi:hypothetical protein